MSDGEHEEVVFWRDRTTGLRAIVAIHDTTLGPGMGGTRMYPYPSEQAALEDVLRLSQAMTYKNAAAGLDFGGGKAVIIGDPATDKTEAFLRSYGRLVETLNGRYLTTTDVGTTTNDLNIISSETRFVTGTSPAYGGSGDTSVLTGYTVFQGMRATAQTAWGTSELRGRTVALQGTGKVGWHLMELLRENGAKLVVTDVNEEQLNRVAAAFNAQVVGVDEIYDVPCDVFSPNALGGSINADTVHRLKCSIVCGGANNQLATPDAGRKLEQRGILYAPDFIVNAGGVINIADEVRGYNAERARARCELVFQTTLHILAMAKEQDITTAEAAESYAKARISTLNQVHSSYLPGHGPFPR